MWCKDTKNAYNKILEKEITYQCVKFLELMKQKNSLKKKYIYYQQSFIHWSITWSNNLLWHQDSRFSVSSLTSSLKIDFQRNKRHIVRLLIIDAKMHIHGGSSTRLFYSTFIKKKMKVDWSGIPLNLIDTQYENIML